MSSRGFPRAGKDVRVPLCVVYDIENEQIKRGRVYLEIPALMRQLAADAESPRETAVAHSA